jgi:chromosome segregation ATPase
MAEWITVKQLALIRKCSERYILSLIKNGTLEARREGKRWMVLVTDSEQKPEQVTEQIPDYAEVINILKKQLAEKDKQIGKLQEQLSDIQKESGEAKERSDMLLLNSQRQLEQSQKMLESSEQKAKRGVWSRLWHRDRDNERS